jgi:hypothetical protein
MDRRGQILNMAAAFSGKTPDHIDPADLFGKDRIEGDDADEFWEAFAREFVVDLSDLRDYLHYDGNEPPLWRTAWGIGADGRRIADIPIGLADLQAAADAGRWKMIYPPHRLYKRRILTPVALPLLLATTIVVLSWSTFPH